MQRLITNSTTIVKTNKRTHVVRSVHQGILHRAVKNLFSHYDVVNNVRKFTGLKSKSALEWDIYIPELKLAFEFQDRYHYFTVWYGERTLEDIRKADAQKKALTEEKGVTLIEIPFWWDGKEENLISTIKHKRPDLLQNYKSDAPPISEEMPSEVANSQKVIEGFGELTQATFYNKSLNPANWLMFEKYDGIRGFWNPEKKMFFSRNGIQLRIPQDIIDNMPSIYLDGEIWFGRNNFNETQKISHKSDVKKIEWNNFKYMVFDIPTLQDNTYLERYKKLEESIPSAHPFIKVAPYELCEGHESLAKFADNIIKQGGEGIILRKPDSAYKHGRSKDYVKFKVFRDDEARIVENVSHEHWKCEIPNGSNFVAPCDPELLKNGEPVPGDIVSYKYTQTSKGVPLSPLIYRARNDMTWEDVVNNYNSKKRTHKEMPLKTPTKPIKPRLELGYWTNPENRRKLFDEFAKEKGFDPLVAENWYKVTFTDVIDRKGMRSLLKHYDMSIRKALVDIYKEVSFNEEQFVKKGIWQNLANCKKFFIEYAKDKGFDPSDTSSWYSVMYKDLHTKPGAGSLLVRFNGSLPRALMETFSDLPWEPEKFKKRSEWSDRTKRRTFFDEIAREKGFDPSKAGNWYKISTKEVTDKKGGANLLYLFGGSVRNALIDAYPELHLNPDMFYKRNLYPDISLYSNS